MKYGLFDYQLEAAALCVKSLLRGRKDWNETQNRSSFALSAMTGSGKTVIATAVIEAMIHGSADLEVDGDLKSSFLWVTDDPALNRQTRNKMLAASDLLQPAQLVVLDNDFLGDSLLPGVVYFLNVQKLSKNSGLAHGGNNLRQYSMWEVLQNTIAESTVDLTLVLDEAHRGVKPAADRKTIVQKIVGGSPNANPPMPVVWGISATISRFTEAMAGATDRTNYPAVEVDIDLVRASGLVKDEIGIDEPDEKGGFGSSLLREAVREVVDYDQRWAAYSEEQNEPAVSPALVVQVVDKATEAHLAELVDVIQSEWPGLGPSSIVHVFGEHQTLHLGARVVDWIQPESIQSTPSARVILAKTAISTGWDCPRAEVLYSERPAKDVTHIAQIIGRMVRSPLTHRIATDDKLNSVACYLPYFDKSALNTIKSEIDGTNPNSDGPSGPNVLRAPKVFERNSALPEAVFTLLNGLPSVPKPDSNASPLRRAKQLARLLTDTGGGGNPLMSNAGENLRATLNGKLDGLAAEHSAAVSANVEDIEHADILRTRITPLTPSTDFQQSKHKIATTVTDIERECRKLIKTVKEGVAKEYWVSRVDKSQSLNPEADPIDVLVQVAALLKVAATIPTIEQTATVWTTTQLATFDAEISNTTGAVKDAYRRVKEQTSTPERINLELRDNVIAATCDGDGTSLPSYSGHIFSNADGLFPCKLRPWEIKVLTLELARPSFVAWYRNPSQPTSASVRIAYQDERWKSLQVDFVIVSRRDDGVLAASIVDPHGDHLADAKMKLQALARYAAEHGDSYARIQSIGQSEGENKVLNLKDASVRAAVLAFEGDKISPLYSGPHAIKFL
jgi:type III restriction enzyme